MNIINYFRNSNINNFLFNHIKINFIYVFDKIKYKEHQNQSYLFVNH